MGLLDYIEADVEKMNISSVEHGKSLFLLPEAVGKLTDPCRHSMYTMMTGWRLMAVGRGVKIDRLQGTIQPIAAQHSHLIQLISHVHMKTGRCLGALRVGRAVRSTTFTCQGPSFLSPACLHTHFFCCQAHDARSPALDGHRIQEPAS